MKKDMPRKAVVLAAGLGTRLRPLTLMTPKPLLPVWGEPMVERVVNMLSDWGVEEVTVNAHHLAEQVEDWAKEYNAKGGKGRPRISVSVEKEILGTGGVLRPLEKWIGDDPFWLVNGDIVIEDLDPAPICEAFERSGRFAACWMAETGPRTIEADPEGRVCNWKSDDAGVNGTYTYCGLALLSPDVIRFLPNRPFATIVEAYEKAMMEEARFVVGVCEPDAFWYDAGTLERYAEVNATEGNDTQFLGARGSDRAFWRVPWDGGKTAIAILYDDSSRPENARYAGHARVLRSAGVPVPKVYEDTPAKKSLVLEDLGKVSLQDRAKGMSGAALVKLYTPVVAALRKFNEVDAADLDLEPAFGPDLFKWERELFAKHCADARFGFESLPADVAKELEGVADVLTRARPMLVHRDFQSSNVLFRPDGTFAIIDFQGMRLGPAAYDLASLLYDPYVDGLGEKERAALAKLYPVQDLPFAAVQRLVQALGAFGRLASVGQKGFDKYIARGLGNLLAAADEADLDALGAFAEELIHRETIRETGFHSHHHHHDEDEEEGV